MSKRRRFDDDPESTDRWLVSYADFITLLFTFFAALYALSSMDTAKMEKFSGSLQQTFKIMDDPIVLGGGRSRLIVRDVSKILKDVAGVSVKSDPRGVVVTFSDAVLFPSGSATIKTEAAGMLGALSAYVGTLPGHIIIEGHTDNVPITGGKYASNWELSAERAAGILHVFLAKGLDPGKFSIAGYAEFKPVAPNDVEENRVKNRRVELVIVLPKIVAGQEGTKPESAKPAP